MKNRHIGELKVVHENSLMNYSGSIDDLIFERVTELTFNFKKYPIDVHESIVKLRADGTIEIECCFYNDKLFTAYKHKDKILTLEVKGTLVDAKNNSKILPYLQTYKKYKFVSMQGSFDVDNNWVYILKPCLF